MDLLFRDAVAADVPIIVAMYADDALGRARESVSDPLPDAYWTAFSEIEADPRHRLVVAARDEEVVATLQLSFLPHLVLIGTQRAQIEAVRVKSGYRGEGIGRAIVRWAINEARQRGCGLIQLTTNMEREQSRAFYEGLGFASSHVGMKLMLDDSAPSRGQT